MKNHFLLAALLLALLVLSCGKPPAEDHPGGLSAFVNPFIGTGGHGHTYPGATVPFGMVQLSPDTRLTGWDGCSGYHYTDDHIYGFSHTHLSGTGISDYGDILFMPNIGPLHFHNGADGEPGYRSAFSKKTEHAWPGYYRVYLKDYGILAELTATERAGFHRYSLEETMDSLHLILDLTHRDKVLESEMYWISDTEVAGFRKSQAWAEEQVVYFVARFSEPVKAIEIEGGFSIEKGGATIGGTQIVTALHFDKVKELKVKVGISAVDTEGARQNLEAEIPHWDFNQVQQEAHEKWEKQLSKIRVETDDLDIKTNFYTALYHNSIVPNLFTDVDGRYRGLDRGVHQATDHIQYTVFSLWDTYRASHPLYDLLERERVPDFINSFLKHYEQGGELPMWELAGNETYCMIGYHSVPAIVDAYAKGIRGFDSTLVLQAMQDIAEQDKFGKHAYMRWGYIPSEAEGESVSKTLEYAYDDWCIAEMARMLGETEVETEYLKRAQSYKNLFDPETGFMRPKNRHRWVSPFDPSEVNFHYTEANAWQYSFYVPQDVSGLIDLHGGEEALVEKLDALFTAESETTGRNQPDITGLIGQYAHGNEPSHHMAYLYNYAGQPWKTQERVHEILTTLYDNAPDGLAGNEDCGQMSAWYIFSAMGFYPVTPGSNDYILGVPILEQATLQLAPGNTFTVKAPGAGKQKYIQSVSLDGQPLNRSWITYADMLAGDTLFIELGKSPNEEWGSEMAARPKSAITEHLITPLPAIARGKLSFFGKDTIELNAPRPELEIRYTLDTTLVVDSFQLYTEPIVIDTHATLRAVAWHPERGFSKVIKASFFEIPEQWSIELATEYAPQYAASGDYALIDRIRGKDDFRTGEWQGYQGVDLNATIDLGEVRQIDTISIGFLQDENSWIFMPDSVAFWGSTDGEDFEKWGSLENEISPKETGTILKSFEIQPGKEARYIRVRAYNRGECPEWHKGAGGKAWIFVDEIVLGFGNSDE